MYSGQYTNGVTILKMLTRLLFLLALIPITLWGEPAVEARIRASLEQEVKPVIFVDLDATLFSEAARVREVLEAYDRQHGTKIFANANWSELSTFSGFETTLDKHLAKATPDAASLAATKKAILAFEHDRRFHPESIRKDQVYTPLKKAIETWETAGAKIVFLTGRDHRVRKVTQEKLAAEGLGRFGLLTKEPDTLTAAFKGDSVTAYQKANPKEKVIALVDDATENLQVVHELHPDVLSLTTTQKNPTTLELEDPLASPTFVTIERYARNYAKWKYAFIPSRLKVHADILAQISGTVGPSPKPLVLFTSGSFGSGKSTVIERLVNSQLIQADHFAWIDPDDIRERVPEYQKFKAVDPKNAGSLVHLEVGPEGEPKHHHGRNPPQCGVEPGRVRAN
jgi:phosphoglycolate phosphatase-like HAD superfamily hydrolase